MRLRSLAFRLFATSAIWTLLVLPVAGVIIYRLYARGRAGDLRRPPREARQRHRRRRHGSGARPARDARQPLRAAVRRDALGLVLADQAARRSERGAARLGVACDRLPRISPREESDARRQRRPMDELRRPGRRADPHGRGHRHAGSRWRQGRAIPSSSRVRSTGSKAASPIFSPAFPSR